MTYILYFISGFIASTLGALPPGAVNLSVVYTTLNRGAKYAIPIILSAAFGEIIISFFALHCAAFVEDYVSNNLLVQYLIAVILIIVGFLMISMKSKPKKNIEKPKGSKNLWKGFLLAILNPPVLIFWLVTFSYLSKKTNIMVDFNFIGLASLFFLGVFLGKNFALYLYLQLSNRIQKRSGDITKIANRVIAIALVVIGVIQLIKLSI